MGALRVILGVLIQDFRLARHAGRFFHLTRTGVTSHAVALNRSPSPGVPSTSACRHVLHPGFSDLGLMGVVVAA
jgi:hypothetical protein